MQQARQHLVMHSACIFFSSFDGSSPESSHTNTHTQMAFISADGSCMVTVEVMVTLSRWAGTHWWHCASVSAPHFMFCEQDSWAATSSEAFGSLFWIYTAFSIGSWRGVTWKNQSRWCWRVVLRYCHVPQHCWAPAKPGKELFFSQWFVRTAADVAAGGASIANSSVKT